MSALNFPANPTLNQVYTENGRSWQWDGTTWVFKPADLTLADVVVALGYEPVNRAGDVFSGNVGLSGAPSAWSASYRTLNIGATGNSITGRIDTGWTGVATNAFLGASGWRYSAPGTASLYVSTDGRHEFYAAGLGTAGAALSWSSLMTLSLTGMLINGTVSATSFVGPLSGNATSANSATSANFASTAAALSTARTLSLTGDVTASLSFDGSGNVSSAATLSNTGISAGTYSKLTVDAKGRATAGSSLLASDIPELTLEKIPSSQRKAPVRVATTSNDNLTGTKTIDGVGVVVGDRVLVRAQNTKANNGIYVVQSGSWTRSGDADTMVELCGAEVTVLQGSTLSGRTFVCPSKGTDSLGSSDINWYESVYDFGTWTINTTGSAGSAATLTTPRTIWGQSFNGSANITGNLTSVGNITGTGAVTLTATSGILALAATGANPITASTNGSVRWTLDSAGNLGLGMTPSAWGSLNRVLQVQGAALSRNDAEDAKLVLSNNAYRDNATGWRYIAGTGTQAAAMYQQGYVTGNHEWYTAPPGTAGSPITFTQAMTLTAAGSLGVGTASPIINSAGKTIHLHADGAGQWSLLHTTNRETGALGGDGSVFGQIGLDAFMFNYEAGGLIFGTNGVTRMQSNSAGNFGVGDGPSESRFRIHRNSASSYYQAHLELVSAVGDVLLAFHAGGDTATLIDHLRGGSGVRVTDGLRASFAPIAASSFNINSDYRIKENVTPMSGALDRLLQLNPIRFSYTKGSMSYSGGRVVDGFFAHEVEPVVPEAVTGRKDEVNAMGQPVLQSLDNSKLVPLLVAAVQELTARIKAAGL
jgi:hypothetical protein